LKGLEDHPVYDIATICKVLADMVSRTKSKRQAAQGRLFGGNIEDEENIWPHVELQWSQAGLISDRAIVQKFTQQIQQRATALKRGGHLDT